MIERLLHRVALFARRRYRTVFAVTGVLVVLSLASMVRLRFDTEVLNLLPADDPVVKSFRDTLEEFGSLDFLLVVVRIPEGAVVDPYLEFTDRLGKRLEALPEIEYVDYRLGELEELVEQYLPSSMLFLDETGWRRVEERLSDRGIEERAAEVRRSLQTPRALALKQLYLLDPLGLSDLVLERTLGGRGAIRVDWTSGYFLSQDRSLLLLVARPVQPAQEIEFARGLLADADRVVAELVAQWPDMVGVEDGVTTPPPPTVGYGGTYATAVDDAGYLTRDIITNAVTSMVGVLLLFLLAFRSLGVLVYAFVPLAVGLVLGLGFAALSVGKLNAITSSFAALLIGLGIDFVIVSYGRWVEERRAGTRIGGALRAMTGSSGRAVVTGGITTAATFFAFLVTDFTGLRQMGGLIGIGILFCMVAILVLLPSLLAWNEDRRRLRRRQTAPLYLHGFGGAPLVRWSWNHPRTVLLLGLLVTLAALALAPRIRFVDSIRQMRPEGNRGVMVETEVGEKFGSGFDYMMLVLRAPTEEEALELTSRVTERALALVGTELNGVDSITSLLPPPHQQRQTLDWLREHRSLLDPDRVASRFAEAAAAEGLNPRAFERGLELYAEAVAVDRPQGLHDLPGGTAERLLERYLREVDGSWKSVVYLYPPPRTWKREAPPGVETLADELGEGVVLTGVNLVSETLRQTVRRDAVVAALVGFVLVGLLLWWDYGRLSDALASLVPLVVGIVWMLGGMELAGIDMNFFNIFVATMIIGIGVDYGVHMTHRFKEGRGRPEVSLRQGLEETGKAIVLAALSTSVGFGSMSLSHYPGLRSMGIVAILGALGTALVAVTLLPAFFRLRHRG